MIRLVLGVLLRLGPRRFRENYGDEVVGVAEERIRAAAERGAGSAVKAIVKEVVGLGLASIRAHRTLANGSAPPGGLGILAGNLGRDLRHAARSVRRQPGHAVTTIVVLALGIGATTAIFSAANSYFFRPLPFTDPDRLVSLWETNPEFGWTDAEAAPANLLDWRERVSAFEDVAGYRTIGLRTTWIHEGEPILLEASQVTGNFFDVLGVRLAAGRAFTWEETWGDAPPVVIVSHGFWTTHLGGREEAIGSTLELDGTAYRVVGVTPRDFAFPMGGIDYWVPYGWARSSRIETWFRRAHFVRPIARLAPGTTLAGADAEFQSVVTALQTEYPETNRVMGAGMGSMRSFLIGDARTPMLLLQGAVGLLLLLACVNVTNLTLLRAASRSREVSVRRALGAGHGRIAGGLITESLVVATAGGVLGLFLGIAGVRGIEGLAPLGIPGATEVALDLRVLALTATLTISCGIVFGLVPSLWARRLGLADALRSGGRSGSETQGGWIRTLVGAELAVAVVLVLAAGLMIRTSLELRSVHPGFDPSDVVAYQVTLPSSRYEVRDDVLATWDDLLERLEATPGVTSAGTVALLPLSGTSWSSQFQAEGWPPDRAGLDILHRRADAGYFEALDIPLVRGRLFGPADSPNGPLVVVINETFARDYFPHSDPIGQRIAYDRVATEDSFWYEIVGIVGDQQQVSPGAPARPEVFEYRNQDWGRTAWVVVETGADVGATSITMRAVLDEIDPLIPIEATTTLRDVRSASIAREEMVLLLLSVFAAIALLLAAVGIYGVTAEMTARRRREMGIRLALGADGGRLIRLVLREGAVPIAAGLAIGAVVALIASRALEGLLFGVSPQDPATLIGVCAALGVLALAAAWIPAWRSTRVDPVASLRADT